MEYWPKHIMTELSKERCRCKESFYWNLTQPGLLF